MTQTIAFALHRGMVNRSDPPAETRQREEGPRTQEAQFRRLLTALRSSAGTFSRGGRTRKRAFSFASRIRILNLEDNHIYATWMTSYFFKIMSYFFYLFFSECRLLLWKSTAAIQSAAFEPYIPACKGFEIAVLDQSLTSAICKQLPRSTPLHNSQA